MRITLNGADHTLDDGITVNVLLGLLNLDSRRVAVEVNLTLVPRSRYDEACIAEGDAVEIVRFIGGG